MFTLVTGFIDRTRYDPGAPKRPVSFYLEHGKALLALPVPKVVFMEEHIQELLKDELASAPTTHIVTTTKEAMEFWPLRPRMLACPLPPGANPEKDTHDYFILMLNKLQWCCQAAELNPWATETFVWMDFGINYLLKQGTLEDAVNKAHWEHIVPRRVRIPGCWPLSTPIHYPTAFCWHFCGTMLAGDHGSLERLRVLQAYVVQRLLNQGLATWEVTVWSHIAQIEPTIFDWYPADHNDLLFTQF
jgi:hypothetical protein